MYLSMAAIVSAGVAGMKSKQSLMIRDVQMVPSAFTHEEAGRRLRDYGVTEEMPTKLELALNSAKENEELQGWIGTELFTQYINVKEKEAEYFSKMTDEERRLKFLGYF